MKRYCRPDITFLEYELDVLANGSQIGDVFGSDDENTPMF